MNKDDLRKTMLFREMTDEEITSALSHLSASEKSYQKGEIILHSGSFTDKMGLVLDGSVSIENNDIWGNRTILSNISKGQFFAETYAYLNDEPLLVDVTANEDCRILFLSADALHVKSASDTSFNIIRSAAGQTHPAANDSWRSKIISNLLMVSLHKNLVLSGRSFHISPKTIRGRVMSYLNSLYIKTGKLDLHIPFDRQQLADYLSVDRTALSKELSKMKEDGLIDYHKNHFVIRSSDVFDV